MLGTILAQQDGDPPPATPPHARRRLGPRAGQASPPGCIRGETATGQSGGEGPSPDERGSVMSVVMWVLVAVVAGLLAGFVMKRGSYGRGWDIALGLIGSVVVSWIFRASGSLPTRALWRRPSSRRSGGGPDRRPAHDLSRACLGGPSRMDASRRAAPESTNVAIMKGGANAWTRTETDGLGQRWSEAQPTKTVVFWGAWPRRYSR